MKTDLNGAKVGVDGNGDGRRGADIGAHEAKAEGHGGGKAGRGDHGGDGGNGGRDGKGGKAHNGPHWAQHNRVGRLT